MLDAINRDIKYSYNVRVQSFVLRVTF